MPERQPRGNPTQPRGNSTPLQATALAAAVIIVGALIWIRPYVTHKREVVASIPAPSSVSLAEKHVALRSPLLEVEFRLPAHKRACMASVAVTPNSRSAVFTARPAGFGERGGPPLEFVLSGAGYRTSSSVAGGYASESLTVPVEPPPHALIATACFINRGNTAALLDGTKEPRVISRSALIIASRPVKGDVALKFLEGRRRSLLSHLGEIFGHASVLTDQLVPVWLIWLLAIAVTLGVPLALLSAFYIALREDEASSAS